MPPSPPETSASGSAAVVYCAAMALFYVAILYSPTVILRLPLPSSIESFMIRRFICALISSAVSVASCVFLLGVRRFEDLSSILGVFGIRNDHTMQAVVFPLFLTSLLYTGTLMTRSWLLICTWREGRANSDCSVSLCEHVRISIQRTVDSSRIGAYNVFFWRNYVVAPFTEELVFRACMVPLLLCGGFKIYSIIFFSPIFFSLAHLNHFLELYYQQRYSFLKAFRIVGLQLGYTIIFGWYAAFLFIRTGSLISPIVAHVFCNLMGLPVLYSPRTKGAASIAFVAGLVAFFRLLFPATCPDLYNDGIEDCRCWNGYCSWK